MGLMTTVCSLQVYVTFYIPFLQCIAEKAVPGLLENQDISAAGHPFNL